MFKTIEIILNPGSGQNTPALNIINNQLKDTDIKWNISVTTQAGDAKKYVKEALNKNVEAIAVYGGDGTVMEVAQILSHTHTPMIILPGGTANVMAKELKIPIFIEQSVKLLTDKNPNIRSIDVGVFNTTPFLIRVNAGVLADMIVEANTEVKSNFGQLAYGISAFQTFREATPSIYKIQLDDEKTFESEGISLVIANSGNIGISGLSFLPEIKIDDGYLNLILIKKSNLGHLASITKQALLDREEHDELIHHKIKKAKITINSKQNIICDDAPQVGNEIEIDTLPQALKVVVPKES